MLIINVEATTLWDEQTEQFVDVPSAELHLEHSLKAISEWESKYKRPFLSSKPETVEEWIYYIKCMDIIDNDVYTYYAMSNKDLNQIIEYTNDSHTASWFSKNVSQSRSSEAVTSELIYYWLTIHNIPFTCDEWNLNRLLTLIKICDIKSQPNKKRSQRDVLSQYSKLNELRKKQLGTKG